MSKRTLVLALTLVALALPAVAGQYVAASWEEAKALSQKHDKPILIDFFTEW